MNSRRSGPPINFNAKWKIIVLITTIFVMAFSSLPSIFGEKEALHISNESGSLSVEQIYSHLAEHRINTRSVEQKGSLFVVTLEHNGLQGSAKKALIDHLGAADTVTLALEPAAPHWLTELGFKPIKLGLDLRGGVQFLLDVDLTPVYKAQAQSLLDQLRSEHRLRGRVVGNEVEVNVSNAEQARAVASLIRTQFSQWSVVNKTNEQFRLALSEDEVRTIRNLTVTQNLQTMRSRIEELGITEAAIQRQGENRIRIELPGVQDPTEAKTIIGATASIAFHEVENRRSARTLSFDDEYGNPVYVSRQPILAGKHITDARASLGEMGTPEVNITLDGAGGRLMSNHSRANIGKPMATTYSEYTQNHNGQTVQNTKVISVATIQSTLSNRFRITGVGSLEDAQNLALLLRAGSLTAPVTIVEERTIGPTLGADNVKHGFSALVLGLSFTLMFIALWYRRLGWIANIALVLNLVCLFGLLALIPGAVLTLPGIAGLVLTVGMAVDTNVLIFERIKDKMKEGRNFAQSIERGFDSAFSSIFDANLTTMIVAIALYAIGNGPIQGFAITLGLGLITSLFTGVFASRILVNHFWGKDTAKEVKL